MPDQAEKVYENRLRRMAERQGLALSKSRRRDPRALDYGQWSLIDTRREHAAAEAGGYDVETDPKRWAEHRRTLEAAREDFIVLRSDSLDDVERFLLGEGDEAAS